MPKLCQSIVRYGAMAFFPFAIVALLLLYLIETTHNAGFWLTIQALSVPLGIITLWLAWLCRRGMPPAKRSAKGFWSTVAGLYAIVLFLCWPYLLAANALTGSGETVEIRGNVTHKRLSGVRPVSRLLTVKDEVSGHSVDLKVRDADYERVSIGDVYGESFRQGGFAIPYRWRFQEPPKQ